MQNFFIRVEGHTSRTDLVGVTRKVKVVDEAGDELAEEEVVRLVDSAHAPVRVVV